MALLGASEHEFSVEIGPGSVCRGIIKKFEAHLGREFDVRSVDAA